MAVSSFWLLDLEEENNRIMPRIQTTGSNVDQERTGLSSGSEDNVRNNPEIGMMSLMPLSE
jgi:hypothetical protein